jgi:hypothetical protein
MDEHVRLGALPKCLAAAPPLWAIAASISTYDQRDEARRDNLPRDAVESMFGMVGIDFGAYLKAAKDLPGKRRVHHESVGPDVHIWERWPNSPAFEGSGGAYQTDSRLFQVKSKLQ